MPRILAISPHFPPLNAPDMQRLRMSLPHWVKAGWEVVVLAVDDREPAAPLEPDLLQTIPAAVRVVRVRCFSRKWTRFLGVGNIGLRALPFLYAAARRLLSAERFDLVYFSTTQFIVLPLGRLWKSEFGVPYVIDLQDPWLSDYYDRPGAPLPPGGWKYAAARTLANRLEGWTLSEASHVISVSQSYLDALARRYPWWEEKRGSVVTFGAPDLDFDLVRKRLPGHSSSAHRNAPLRIVYAGRLGPDMLPALEILFTALAGLKGSTHPFEVCFYGTSYAAAGEARPTTAALAHKHGIADIVREFPARIGYLDSLQRMLEADLLLLLGSDDPSYSPSKIYPTLMCGRPTIAIAPAGSVMQRQLETLGGAAAIVFTAVAAGDSSKALGALLARFAMQPGQPLADPLNLELLSREYSAGAIAARQIRIFSDFVRVRHHRATT